MLNYFPIAQPGHDRPYFTENGGRRSKCRSTCTWSSKGLLVILPSNNKPSLKPAERRRGYRSFIAQNQIYSLTCALAGSVSSVASLVKFPPLLRVRGVVTLAVHRGNRGRGRRRGRPLLPFFSSSRRRLAPSRCLSLLKQSGHLLRPPVRAGKLALSSGKKLCKSDTLPT